MAKIKDDIKSYTDALGDIPPKATFIDEELEDGRRHYSGALGDFVYDPNMFQIQLVNKEADDNGPAYEMECLHYIGPETDGNKITIPDGITNGNFMFANTNIESMPNLPTSLQSAFHMFGNCQELKEATKPLPPYLKDMSFMFMDCRNLEHGPKVIHGNVKDAGYAFANCGNLQNTPTIGEGVENLNGTFAFCGKLKQTPHLPYSAKEADDITLGCKGMDASEKDVTIKNRDKARERYLKKLEKPSFRERITGAFSAIMQVYSMQKMGFGCVAAPIMVHQMRKNGQLGRDLGSGIAYLAMSKSPGPMTRILYQSSMKRSQTVAAKKEARKQEKMEQWDRLFGEGSDFNKRTKAMAASAKRDYKHNLFSRILGMNAEQRAIFKESHGNETIINAQREQAQVMYDTGQMNVKNGKVFAAWFKERLEEKRAYAIEAKELITNDKSLSDNERQEAFNGLTVMNEINLKPLVSTIQRLQAGTHLFDVRDQKDIDKMMKDITGKPLFDIEAKEKAGITTKPLESFKFGQTVITPMENKPIMRDGAFIDTGDGIKQDNLRFETDENGVTTFFQKEIKSIFVEGEPMAKTDDALATPSDFKPIEFDIKASMVRTLFEKNDESFADSKWRVMNMAEPDRPIILSVKNLTNAPQTAEEFAKFIKSDAVVHVKLDEAFYQTEDEVGEDHIARPSYLSAEHVAKDYTPMEYDKDYQEPWDDPKAIAYADAMREEDYYHSDYDSANIKTEFKQSEATEKATPEESKDKASVKEHADSSVSYNDDKKGAKKQPKAVAEDKSKEDADLSMGE